MNRRNFLASIIAAVAMAPALLRFKAELPEVTVTIGTWQEVIPLTYRWEANGASLGYDGKTYTVKGNDIGKLVTCTITVA